MKSFSSGIDSKLNSTTGTEPILIVGVQWGEGDETLYSDRKIADADYPYPKILSIGNFDTSMTVKGASDSLNAKIVLDDIDGSLKTISKTLDIHKSRVKIYLMFKGLSLSEKVLLFDGELVTPIEWGEGDRSLSFDVLSKLEGRTVGFSMEEGDFPNIPEEALGKAWPLVFGEVCHIPAVKVRAPRQGHLIGGVGIHDWTLDIRLCQAQKLRCPLVFTKNELSNWGKFAVHYCYKTHKAGYYRELCLENSVNPVELAEWKQATTAEKQCRLDRHAAICNLKFKLENQLSHEVEQVDIYNGVKFPQDQTVKLYIGGSALKGSFTGNTFTVTERQHSKYNDWEPYECEGVGKRSYQSILMPADGTRQQELLDDNGEIVYDNWNSDQKPSSYSKHSGAENSILWRGDQLAACNKLWRRDVGPTGGVVDAWKKFNDMDGESFDWHPPGSEVFLLSESEVVYIVSLIPGVVTGVAAYKTLPNGKVLLTTVPAEYYTVHTVDYGTSQVTEIHLLRELSLLNTDFDSQLYVSFISSVGPNIADVFTWLVEQYTELSIDANSFASVKSDMENYPVNMALLDRPNVYNLIQDIAYQGRCGVFVRDNTLFLKYLPKEPTSVLHFTSSDILNNSFVDRLSNSSDITTHHVVGYTKAGAELDDSDTEHLIDLKYNVGKYGDTEKKVDYFSQNTFSTILKSATFWLIRESNSWRMIKFKLPMKHMALDIMDCITLDFPSFSSSQVKCVITALDYSPKDCTIEIECWTPIRSGESEEYYWAWPANKNKLKEWPLPGDTNGTNGYNSDMKPPEGHLLAGGFHTDDNRSMSLGDKHPSDLDDSFPDIICEVSEELEDWAFEPAPSLKAWVRAKANQASLQEQNIAGAPLYGSFDDEEDDEDEDEDSEDTEDDKSAGEKCCGSGTGACEWCVEILMHQSEGQGTNLNTHKGCGGPCGCQGGCPSCYGTFWWKRRTYSSYAGALAFLRANPPHGDHWDCMEVGVQGPGGIRSCRAVDANTGRPCTKTADNDAATEPNVPTNGMIDNAHVNDSDDPYWTNPNIPSVGAGVGTPSGGL